MKKVFVLLLFFTASLGVFAQNYIQHTVVKDDTVTNLARKYGVTIHDIYQLNPEAKNGIKLGEIILIPKTEKNSKFHKKSGLYHKVEPKETFFGIAQKYGTTIQAIQEANKDILENGLQPDIELLIPTGERVENTSTIIRNKDIIHVVQPQETLFGIYKKYEISKEELIKNNPQFPHLKDEVIKIGDTIKISLKKMEEVSSQSSDSTFISDFTFKDLSKNLKNSERKKIVIMLPFNASGLGESSDAIREAFKTNRFLNVTVDFYSGALVAIDSIKRLGGNFDIVFYDSEETNSGSAIQKLIASHDFSNVDAIIGPLMSTHAEKAASLLSSKGVIVVSPLSREGKTTYNNLYLATPPTEVSKKMMLTYLKNKNQNTIAIVDKRKQSSKDFIAKNFSGISFATFNEAGALDVEHLKSLLKTNQPNYVILETESSSMILNVTKILTGLIGTYPIKLVALDKNQAFESDEIHSTTLANLNLHYPSAIRDFGSETNSFYLEYKKKNNVFPSQFAVRGFDVVFDVLLRLSQKEDFEKLAKNTATEYIDSKFSYVKSSEGGYYNTGVYILYYDTDLTIKEAE